MAERRRKMILGFNCDEYGVIIGCEPNTNLETYTNLVEYIIMDIDNLRLQKVVAKNLPNIERNHKAVNFMTETNGAICYIPREMNIANFARFYKNKFLQETHTADIWCYPSSPFVLLGRLLNNNQLVGYRIYNCQTRQIIDYKIGNEFQQTFWGELGKKFSNMFFRNASWVQLAFKGQFYNEECYPIFKI